MTIGTSSSIYHDPHSADINRNVHAARLEARVALAGTLARFPRWDIVVAELVAVQTRTVRGFSSVPTHL